LETDLLLNLLKISFREIPDYEEEIKENEIHFESLITNE